MVTSQDYCTADPPNVRVVSYGFLVRAVPPILQLLLVTDNQSIFGSETD